MAPHWPYLNTRCFRDVMDCDDDSSPATTDVSRDDENDLDGDNDADDSKDDDDDVDVDVDVVTQPDNEQADSSDASGMNQLF